MIAYKLTKENELPLLTVTSYTEVHVQKICTCLWYSTHVMELVVIVTKAANGLNRGSLAVPEGHVDEHGGPFCWWLGWGLQRLGTQHWSCKWWLSSAKDFVWENVKYEFWGIDISTELSANEGSRATSNLPSSNDIPNTVSLSLLCSWSKTKASYLMNFERLPPREEASVGKCMWHRSEHSVGK